MMIKKRFFYGVGPALLSTILLILALGGSLFAQGLTAVTGRVTDASGAVIPGVEVTVTNSATGSTRTAISNETGVYSISQLQPGTYSVKAELTGFKTKQVSNVVLPVEQTITLNLPLEVGQVTDVVDVVASAEIVNTVDAKLGVGFDSKRIIDLPLNARNIVGLLGLQAGVSFSQTTKLADGTERDDGGQVNGARNDQQNIVLDGVDINAQERGSSFEGALPTTLDSVQEFLVQTAGQSGQASRSSGAQIQLVTKSGSNAFHGSAYEFYRSKGTSARNYFAREATPLIRHLPGGSIGGPLLKDKLFFFGAFERQTDRSASLVAKNIPTTQFLNGTVRYQRRDRTFGVISDGPGGMLERFSQLAGDRWNPAILGPNSLLEKFRPFSSDTSRTTPGSDNGANILIYRFQAPNIRDRNIYISRFDYNLNSRNTLFVRGTLNDDARTLTPETLPGFNNARKRLDNSKGFSASWNFVISPNVNSNFNASLTRESFEDTGNSASYLSFGLFSPQIQTAGAQRQYINTWNLVENLSWLKGNHNIQAGANARYILNHLSSYDAVAPAVFNSASANLTFGGIGGASSPGLRRALGDAEFALVADPGVVGDAVLLATGSITQFNDNVQFGVDGKALPGGTPLVRNTRLNEFDAYFQDSWKLKSNMTLSYGLSYSLTTPPWEKNGVQVNWTQDLGARWNRQKDSTVLASQFPLFQAEAAGRANGKPDYYKTDKNNIAPRASFAWTPGLSDGFLGKLTHKGGQTVIRGGYALTFDRTGGRFARDAALTGSVGLKTTVNLPGFSYSFDGTGAPRAPRVGVGGSLPRSEFPSQSTASFVIRPSAGGWGGPSNLNGIDPSITAPRNHVLNLTVTRELPGGFVVEASYVGRMARGLLGQVDIASPINVRDSRSNTTYYDAIKALYENYQMKRVPVANVQPIPWFENVYGGIQAYAQTRLKTTFNSATQAFYAMLNDGFTPGPNAQANITDQINFYEAETRQNILTTSQAQFFGLFSNFGRSNYNSGQLTVRKRFSGGYTFSANYTLSKSLDITSAAESRGNRANGTTGEGLAEDPYHPELSYAISDFDRRHQFNANFLIEFPFGKGKRFAGNSSGVIEHLIGGWDMSGIAVSTSGRPFNFTSSNRFNHHFFGRTIPALVQPIPWELTKSGGRVFLIGGTADNRNNIAENYFQSSYPGSAIARNQGRGPRFDNIDMSISKRIQVTEGMTLRFRAEAFNVLNHPNFSTPVSAISSTNGLNVDRRGGGLGEVLETQGTERVMQFSLRLVF